jgi:hypothetical protein
MPEWKNRIEVVQNDYGYFIELKLTDANDNPVDLTSATAIKAIVAEPGSSTAKLIADCTVISATDGTCKFRVPQGAFNEPNKEYHVEVEVTYSDREVTARGLRIFVVKELPETVG